MRGSSDPLLLAWQHYGGEGHSAFIGIAWAVRKGLHGADRIAKSVSAESRRRIGTEVVDAILNDHAGLLARVRIGEMSPIQFSDEMRRWARRIWGGDGNDEACE